MRRLALILALMALTLPLVAARHRGRVALLLPAGTCEDALRAQIEADPGFWVDLEGVLEPGACLEIAPSLAPRVRTCCVTDDADPDRSHCSPRADEDRDGVVDSSTTGAVCPD